MRNYSISAFFAVILLSACGGPDITYQRPDGTKVEIDVTAKSSVGVDATALDAVVRRYGGVCSDKALNQRAYDVLARVLPLFDVRDDILITCVDGDEATALVVGARHIVVSRAMLSSMTGQGEMEFVVGHELAHLYWADREKFARLEELADAFLAKEAIPVSTDVQARANFLGEANAIRNLFLDMEYKADALTIRRLSTTAFSPCGGSGLAFVDRMTTRWRAVHPWMLQTPQEDLLRVWLRTGQRSVNRYKVHPFLAQRRHNIQTAMRTYCPGEEL